MVFPLRVWCHVKCDAPLKITCFNVCNGATSVNHIEPLTGTTLNVVLGTISNDSGESFDFTVTGDSSRYTVTPADGSPRYILSQVVKPPAPIDKSAEDIISARLG